MLRALAAMAALAGAGCHPNTAPQLASRLVVRIGVGEPSVRGFAPLTVTWTVATRAGGSLACASIAMSVSELLDDEGRVGRRIYYHVDEPDCDPQEGAEPGVHSEPVTFGSGTYLLEVQAWEPHRKPARAWAEVHAL